MKNSCKVTIIKTNLLRIYNWLLMVEVGLFWEHHQTILWRWLFLKEYSFMVILEFYKSYTCMAALIAAFVSTLFIISRSIDASDSFVSLKASRSSWCTSCIACTISVCSLPFS